VSWTQLSPVRERSFDGPNSQISIKTVARNRTEIRNGCFSIERLFAAYRTTPIHQKKTIGPKSRSFSTFLIWPRVRLFESTCVRRGRQREGLGVPLSFKSFDERFYIAPFKIHCKIGTALPSPPETSEDDPNAIVSAFIFHGRSRMAVCPSCDASQPHLTPRDSEPALSRGDNVRCNRDYIP
jgi:hypothetical protein